MGVFDFTEEKISTEEIVKIAQRNGHSILRVAISHNGYRQSQSLWGQPDASSIYDGDVLCMVLKRIRGMSPGGKGVIGMLSLYNDIRKMKRFKGGNAMLMSRLKDEIIPELEKMNLVCLIRDCVYTHPAIIEADWDPNFKVYEGEHPSRLPYHLRYSEDEVEVAMEFYRKAKLLLNGK